MSPSAFLLLLLVIPCGRGSTAESMLLVEEAARVGRRWFQGHAHCRQGFG
jgi:hypothetical protein